VTLLIRRAQRSGALRRDFVSQDLVVFLMANAGVVSATRSAAPTAGERFAAYVIEAVRAPGTVALPPPPRPGQMLHAMEQAGSPHVGNRN
jgi:hypothetical protein